MVIPEKEAKMNKKLIINVLVFTLTFVLAFAGYFWVHNNDVLKYSMISIGVIVHMVLIYYVFIRDPKYPQKKIPPIARSSVR